jgi:hypothetical protein
MTRRTEPRVPEGAWPALMTVKTAAGYVDERSAEEFRRKVGRIYPEPIRLWGVGVRWRKTDLDNWIDGLRGERIVDAADLL